MRMGIMSATIGVLLRNAEANITGIIILTWGFVGEGAGQWQCQHPRMFVCVCACVKS